MAHTQDDGLVVEHLSVTYPAVRRSEPGVLAVDDVSLQVPSGQVLGLLGPSGCGKSTLLRAIAGVEPISGGRVLWDGEDLTSLPAYRRGFGLVFQDGQLFAHRTVGANVAYGLEAQHMPRPERAARVAELLEIVGLADLADRPVSTLSGGQRQRVALVRALAPRPRVLLLDEPLSALDHDLRDRLAQEVREILQRTGTTAILVTHDAGEAHAIAGRVVQMSAGRLVEQ